VSRRKKGVASAATNNSNTKKKGKVITQKESDAVSKENDMNELEESHV
jgi:hypothetical protein